MPPPAYRLTPVKGLSPKAAWYRISDSSNASGHNPLHNQLSAIFNHAVRYYEMMDKDVITTPKTKKSNRTIKMPHFLCEEMQEYLGMLYGLKKKDRIFTVTKSYLHHEMDRGAKVAGVKRIRIHDLRHSHISLLIDMGFSAVAIADRVGHESIEITYQYAHLFPSKQAEMAKRLDNLGKGDFENVS